MVCQEVKTQLIYVTFYYAVSASVSQCQLTHLFNPFTPLFVMNSIDQSRVLYIIVHPIILIVYPFIRSTSIHYRNNHLVFSGCNNNFIFNLCIDLNNNKYIFTFSYSPYNIMKQALQALTYTVSMTG